MFAQGRLVLPLLLLMGQAIAGETWSTPIKVGMNPSGGEISADINQDGDAVIVYNHIERNESGPDQMWVEAVKKTNDSWTSPARLSDKIDYTDITQWIEPKAAIDDSGFCNAIWKYTDASGQEGLKCAWSWGPDVWIQNDAFPSTLATSIDQYEIAHDKDSHATVVSAVQRDRQFYLETAQFHRASHLWSSIDPISLTDRCKNFDIRVDSQGITWLVWVNYTYPKDVVYVTSLLPDDKKWGPPQILAKCNPDEDIEPKLAIDPKDNVFICWQQNEKKQKYVFQIYKKPGDTIAWIKTEFPTVKNTTWPDFQVTFDQKGNALLLWDQNYNLTNSASLSPHGEQWQKSGSVLKDWAITWESAISKQGNRLLVYSDDSAKSYKAITLPIGKKKWTAPVTVAPQTYVNGYIYRVGCYGDKALVIYGDDNAVQVVQGSSLFNK